MDIHDSAAKTASISKTLTVRVKPVPAAVMLNTATRIVSSWQVQQRQLGASWRKTTGSPSQNYLEASARAFGYFICIWCFHCGPGMPKAPIITVLLRPSGSYQPYGKFQPRCPCKYQTGSSFQVVQVFNAIRG